MTTLTARSSGDLLAVVPVVLGFVPTDSVVMLTFGATRPFHARIDLPPPGSAEDLAGVVDALLGPARRHGVARVAFVLFGEPAGWCEDVGEALVEAFVRVGVGVVDAVRADGSRWYPLGPAPDPAGGTGTPYDLGNHRFTAQAVLEGKVTLGSRDELAASLRGGRHESAGVVAAMSGIADEPWLPPVEVRRVVEGGLGRADPLGDLDVARLLRSLPAIAARDAAWRTMTRETAQQHVALWTGLTRRSPEDLVAGPASLLAFAAWLAGHGALAWCAVDRCREVEPDHRLAALLARLLEAAVPPSEWRQWPESLEWLEGAQGGERPPGDDRGSARDRSLRPSG